MARKNFWDVVIWIAMAVLIGYIILKLAGIINTPEWVDLLPIITIALIIGAFYQKSNGFMEVMYGRTDYLKSNLDEDRNNFREHDKRIGSLESKKKI